jgi:hypothetical protein
MSYPCSGRTFTTLLLNDLGAKVFYTHYGLTSHPSVNTVKMLEKYPNKFDNDKVLIITRDAKDTITSYYFNMKYRVKRIPLSMTFTDFIKHDRFGIKNILEFNYKSVTLLPKSYNLKFENLVSVTDTELTKVCSFLDVIPALPIVDVVNKWTFDYCRKFEEENGAASLAKEETDFTNPEAYKFRKGKIEGYLDYMSKSDIEYCNDAEEKYKS